jgi:hypothetical protein
MGLGRGKGRSIQMKKIHLLGFALVAMLAFSAFAAVSASAEITLLAEWLINGVGVVTLTSVETKGSLELTDTATAFGSATSLCPDTGEGAFDGTVGPNGEDEITEVLTAAGLAVGTDVAGTLTGTGLKCLGVKICAAEADAEVFVANLPWHTLLFLMESGAMLDRIFGSGAGKEPGYELVCLIGGIPVTDLCEGPTSSTMENMLSVDGLTNDLLGNFDATSEPASCSLGNATSGKILGEGLLSTLDGSVLTVSSEGFAE